MKRLTPLKAIRKKCLDCSGHIKSKVRNCEFDGVKDEFCLLYPYRMGKNPKLKGKGNIKNLDKSKKRGSDTLPESNPCVKTPTGVGGF